MLTLDDVAADEVVAGAEVVEVATEAGGLLADVACDELEFDEMDTELPPHPAIKPVASKAAPIDVKLRPMAEQRVDRLLGTVSIT